MFLFQLLLSKDNERIGFGVHIPSNNLIRCLHHKTSIFTAEARTLLKAVEAVSHEIGPMLNSFYHEKGARSLPFQNPLSDTVRVDQPVVNIDAMLSFQHC